MQALSTGVSSPTFQNGTPRSGLDLLYALCSGSSPFTFALHGGDNYVPLGFVITSLQIVCVD